MHWNHRVVRALTGNLDEKGNAEYQYEFREVYYDDTGIQGHGRPFMCSETMEGLTELVQRLQVALTNPVVDVPPSELGLDGDEDRHDFPNPDDNT